MRNPQQLLVGRVLFAFIIWAAVVFSLPLNASAQENKDQSSFVSSVTKSVLFDPTTYAPAAIAYGATLQDWNSSQPLFNHGFYEHNARFTISGRPDDVPMGYADGHRRILRDALANLQMSLVNNATDSVIERLLIAKHPEHRKLFRVLSWAERISFASYMSYRLSADHFRQVKLNEQRMREMGLK